MIECSPDSILQRAKEELLAGYPAAACARIGDVVRADPRNAAALHLQGLIAAHDRNFESAAAEFETAIAACPEKIEWNNDLAVSLGALGRWSEAAEKFARALEANPENPAVLSGRGRALLESGEISAAIACLEEALRIAPDFYPAVLNLGRALAKTGKPVEAAAAFTRAAELRSAAPEPYRELATIYSQHHEYETARQFWKAALERSPGDPEATSGLIRSCWFLGNLDETLDLIEESIAEGIDVPGLAACRLSTILHKPGMTACAIRAQSEEYARAIIPPVLRSFEDRRSNAVPGARLRIGYITGEFIEGSPFYFLSPLLGNHDRQAFEIFLYHTRDKYDSVTEWFSRAGNWRDCRGMSDAAIGSLIDRDAIDILVDLSGFFPGNKLRMMAGRAAPVQMTYPNCPGTTGVAAIDYIFTDRWTCPPGHEDWYTEQPVFLPSGYLAFAPAADAPDVTRLPAQNRGYVTFGIFQRRLKHNAPFWDAAAEVLRRLPYSRLVIQHSDTALDDPDSQHRDELLARFISRGISESRIGAIGPRSHRETLATMGRVDIALDTFPYQGQTTTCECLWQGVPPIALTGETHVARVGTAILERVGLGDLATSNAEAYVQRAVKLASDPGTLAQLRAGMRERLRKSTLLDGQTLARDMEAAYRDVWRAWIEGKSRRFQNGASGQRRSCA